MSDANQSKPVPEDDHWEVYVTYVDEKPAVILVDISVSKIAPIVRLPNLSWVWVYLQNPDDDGFPTDEEDVRLNEIEDSLNDSIDLTGTKYVGRVTSDGRREFYFYAENSQSFRESVSAAMQSVTGYRFEIDETDDEEWRHYCDVLYPSSEDLQQIRNQHEITRLQEAGDSLTKPRPVDHFVNFKTTKDRAEFIALAEDMGFEVASQPTRDDAKEYPFSLGLLRVDAVDPETVDEVTFELWELAQHYHGEYDGWCSTVIKK